MAVTLKDVAKHCGLAFSTVSGVLGKRSHLFSEATRQKVLNSVKELGYRPHAIARAMRRGKFDAVTLIMSTTYPVSVLPPHVLAGIQETIAKSDMHLSVNWFSNEQLTNETSMPEVLNNFFSDGFIINYTSGVPSQMEKIIKNIGLPSIWMNIKQEHNAVRPDDYGGALKGTEILISRGHKRIACIGVDPHIHYHVKERKAGYLEAMKLAGLEPEIVNLSPDLSMDEEIQIYRKLLSKPDRPTAIFTIWGQMAQRIFFCASQVMHWSVPADLSLMTISEPWPYGQTPEFDAMILPNFQVGQSAAELLLERIGNPDNDLQAKVVPMEYVRGYTIAPPSL